MKKILLLFALTFLVKYVNSQDSLINYVRIVDIAGMTKTDGYDKALIWLSKVFVNSKAATFVQERESGIISGKGEISDFEYRWTNNKGVEKRGYWYHAYNFNWKVELKNGKFRFTIDDLLFVVRNGGGINFSSKLFSNFPQGWKLPFTNDENMQLNYQAAIKSLKIKFNNYVDDLTIELNKKDNW